MMRGNSRKSYTLEEAQRRMEQFCAYRERCHQEVVSKLREMRMIPEAIDTIVAHLIESGYLNEERFALEFSRGKFRQKGWGKNRIKRELKMREVSDYLIRKSLEEIDPEDYQMRFEALAQKRWDQLRGEQDHARKKRKFMDYFLYRGWETQRIFEYFPDLEGQPDG